MIVARVMEVIDGDGPFGNKSGDVNTRLAARTLLASVGLRSGKSLAGPWIEDPAAPCGAQAGDIGPVLATQWWLGSGSVN